MIGRDDENERIGGFLDASSVEAPRALVLEGEAGIGKSTLWLEGLDLARERGLRVLSSRPAEAERSFALAGLADLFEGALDEVLPALAPPRRRALEVALLLEETEDPVAPRAVAVAVRSALELLAEAQPLLVAVDDVQWFDPSSTAALAFALRRSAGQMHLLLARRSGTIDPTSLESALPAPSVERLQVGPLTVGALQAVLRERLDRVFPRPTLLRIHETSGGNPFYALELARCAPGRARAQRSLAVYRRHWRSSFAPGSTPCRGSCAAGARAPGRGRGGGDGHAAEGRRPRTRSSRRSRTGSSCEPRDSLRFTHPLLAASVYQHADEATRRSAHAALAAVVRDPLGRARHLALAAEGADAEIAASLDEAAIVAGRPRRT